MDFFTTWIAPAMIGLLWICVFSLFPEPTRQRLNALMVCGAGAAYISSGALGFGELAFTTVMTAVAYFGLRDYRWLALGWMLHTCWDIVHHHLDAPIIPRAPASSFGCAICDPVVAVWLLFGAPSIWTYLRRRSSRTDVAIEDEKASTAA